MGKETKKSDISVCVYVCVCERERGREGDREISRQKRKLTQRQ